MSERFREERLGRQLLSFQVGIEHHGQIADKDSSEPSGPNFIWLKQNQSVFARSFETRQFVGKILIEIDVKLACYLLLDDHRMAKQAADDRASQLIILG